MGAKEEHAHDLEAALRDAEAKLASVKEYAVGEADRAAALEAANGELQAEVEACKRQVTCRGGQHRHAGSGKCT